MKLKKSVNPYLMSAKRSNFVANRRKRAYRLKAKETKSIII